MQSYIKYKIKIDMNNNFKYSCIGDNTPENREYLEKLEYRLHPESLTSGKLLYSYTTGYYWIIPELLSGLGNGIDCRNNDPLFQAVTAISDDDNDYQYYFWISK